MKRIAISFLSLAIAAAGSAGAQGYGPDRDGQRTHHSDRAEVLRVDRVGNPYAGPSTYEREECWNEQTNGYDSGYYRDNDGRLYRGDGRTNTGGMLLGALVGGALGNTVGKGDGRKAATVAGAVIGGTIGAHAGDNHDDYEYRGDNGVVRRCRTVVTNNDDNRGYGGPGGYNVTYRYAGQTYQAFTNYRPGRYIRVTVDVRPDDNGGYHNY